MYINESKVPIEINKLFFFELKKQGRTLHWLANQLDFCYDHTRKLIQGKLPLTKNNVQKINEALGTDY